MLQNTRIALINGPLNCGKDEAIKFALKKGLKMARRECKDKLHELTQSLFCVSEGRYWALYDNRLTKELPVTDFMVTWNAFKALQQAIDIKLGSNRVVDGIPHKVMLSVREAVIYVSEVVAKPTMGKDYFGKVRTDTIKEGENAVDGSCAFIDEIYPTLNRLGEDNVLLIRVKGRGGFAPSDSRGYIPDGVVPRTIDIWNNKDETSYLNLMYNVLSEFFRRD